MLASLWLPIVLSGVALFFVSFLSWMVFKFHDRDWNKLANEDAALPALRGLNVPPGNYMFPRCTTMDELKTPEFQEKMKDGPNGVITVFPGPGNMGRNLALTFLYFLAVSFCLAYLATIGLKPGAAAMEVFRFFATAGFLTFCAANVSDAIWFRHRVVGHLIDAVLFGLVLGGLFAALWPTA
jgi:hypothetical protein